MNLNEADEIKRPKSAIFGQLLSGLPQGENLFWQWQVESVESIWKLYLINFHFKFLLLEIWILFKFACLWVLENTILRKKKICITHNKNFIIQSYLTNLQETVLNILILKQGASKICQNGTNGPNLVNCRCKVKWYNFIKNMVIFNSMDCSLYMHL